VAVGELEAQVWIVVGERRGAGSKVSWAWPGLVCSGLAWPGLIWSGLGCPGLAWRDPVCPEWSRDCVDSHEVGVQPTVLRWRFVAIPERRSGGSFVQDAEATVGDSANDA
jgi:hypothetical protein